MNECHCDECNDPGPPDPIGPIAITARKVTVFQVNRRGKRWSNRAAAYRAAARRLVWNACLRHHEVWHSDLIPEGETCRYCSKECEGHRSNKHQPMYKPHELCDASDFECNDPTHAYRYRLMTRLTRWLRWRDALAKDSP